MTDPLACLSRREREVARHLAHGLSNREIAETLVITQKTVETYLGRLMDKVDIRSTRRLVAWLASQRVEVAAGWFEQQTHIDPMRAWPSGEIAQKIRSIAARIP